MKIQKNKNKLNIFIIPILISSQFILSSNSNEYLLAQDNDIEKRNLIDEAIELNPLIEEIINKKDNDLIELKDKKIDLDDKDNNLNNSVKIKKKEDNNLDDSIKNKKIKRVKSTTSIEDSPKNKENTYKFKKKYLPIPKDGEISVGQFQIPARGYVKLKEQKILLNLVDAKAIETLKLIAKLGNYGIVVIENDNKEVDDSLKQNNKLITVSFDEIDISDAFNSILMASNLQAKMEKNIIFIGEDILNKSLSPNISKTYRINQANAASVADYLRTLGAKISKVFVKGSSNDGAEIEDRFKQADLEKSSISSYDIKDGPLIGLIGTVDLRLQTITLIGPDELIKTSEKYIKAMDRRHRQVALSIKIIDVSLTKTDLKNNMFELRAGDTSVINNNGISVVTANTQNIGINENSNISNLFDNGIAQGKWLNWLEAKITNNMAKVMASPTLILGENQDANLSGAAAIDDSLAQATIGRPFSNEGFIKVGESVITGFSKTTEDGVTTCSSTTGTAGITFGAKVDKIDDNGYVTFSLSPAISSVTSTTELAGCGIQSTLSVRKLDTGLIRVKNKNTLILTGVIKDEDTVTTSKVPILGDIPILGSLFRSNSDVKRKSELIILVTPNILKDDISESYEL